MGTEIFFQFMQGRRGLVDDQQEVEKLPWAITVISGGTQELLLQPPSLCFSLSSLTSVTHLIPITPVAKILPLTLFGLT